MKIYCEKSLRDFKFWSGGADRAKDYTPEQMDMIEHILEDLYPDGVDETEINDLFWFKQSTIDGWLGINRDKEEWIDNWDDAKRVVFGRHIEFCCEDDTVFAFMEGEEPPVDVLAEIDVDEDETPEWHIERLIEEIEDNIKSDWEDDWNELDADLKAVMYMDVLYEAVLHYDEITFEDENGCDLGPCVKVDYSKTAEENLNDAVKHAKETLEIN